MTPQEVEAFLVAIHDRYGYDFRRYARASLLRRLKVAMQREHVTSVEALTDRALGSADAFARVLDALTVSVTEMFRDPKVYSAIREKVFPYLQTYSELKVWHPGCSTGEEVYSLAVLLEEAGLYARTLSYGTDINPRALSIARDGIVKSEAIAQAARGYVAAGGRYSFDRYYTEAYGAAILVPALKKNLVFSDHNLVTDQKFGEMNLILCRNVLIYFDVALQARVVGLLWDSLCIGGFLCLGAREHLDLGRTLEGYREIDRAARLYQKKA